MARPVIIRIFLIVHFIFILTGSGFAQEIRYGSLYQLITQIRNAMPGQNSYAFVIPTLNQMNSFRAAVNHIIDAQYQPADSLARQFGYGLYEWYDTSQDSSLFYVLMEPTANVSGGVALGWGTYIFDPDGEREVIIEVPHPYFDTNTWQVGFVSYQATHSAFFLMAGTHRYANGTDPRPADVAHNTQNMFHVVHQAVSPLSQHSLQVHGFSRTNNPGYPDVILSNGTFNPGLMVDSLANQIISEGYTVGIFDGINWTNLGATTNTQGQWSNANGYSFIHMELEYFIRISFSHWERFVNILYRTFYFPLVGWPVISPAITPGDFELLAAYPNPFNSQVTLAYRIPGAGQVTVDIFDLLGRRIRTVNDEVQTAGDRQLRWNGRDDSGREVSSGQYLVRIKWGNSHRTRKISYIR